MSYTWCSEKERDRNAQKGRNAFHILRPPTAPRARAARVQKSLQAMVKSKLVIITSVTRGITGNGVSSHIIFTRYRRSCKLFIMIQYKYVAVGVICATFLFSFSGNHHDEACL